MRFLFQPARPEDPYPYNSGFVFNTRIENRRHGVTVSFDERSTGFISFFSFLVWFSQVRKNYGENLVILLDEPGLTLHGTAQSDLLRYINERLRSSFQVIYTTHSPFMVDPENILAVRTVEDLEEEGEVIGTKVGDKVLAIDRETILPLQAALGYDITQTLFVGTNTVVVEGPSDLLYLSWFSAELRRSGRVAMDSRWTIAPVGTITKIGSFVALVFRTAKNLAVITDFATGGKSEVRRLRESEILKEGHVLTNEKYAGQDEADIEDVIGRETYIGLVHACYGLTGKKALPATRPQDAPIRVVNEIEAHFKLLPKLPEFDHYEPAEYLTKFGSELRNNLPALDLALDRFESLFTDLNALLVD